MSISFYIPREARFDIEDKASGLTLALAYKIDAQDNMMIDATATPQQWQPFEAILYDIPAQFSLALDDLASYAEAIRKDKPPFLPYASTDSPPFQIALTNNFIGRGIVLLVRLKKDNHPATIAAATSAVQTPVVNLFVGDDYYCSIYRDRTDKGDIYRYCQESPPVFEARIPGIQGTAQLVDVSHCKELPEEGVQFFAIFAFASVFKQMFQSPSAIGSDYLRSTFDEMEKQGISSQDVSMDPVGMAIMNSLWFGMQSALPAPREHLKDADKYFKDFLDSSKSPAERIVALAGFLGHCIMTVVEWVPGAAAGEAVAEDAARDFKTMVKEIETSTAETVKGLEAAKKVIPGKAADFDQMIQRAKTAQQQAAAAEAEITSKLAALDAAGKKNVSLVFANGGTKLWGIRKQNMSSYWGSRAAKGEATEINAVLGSGKRAEGHYVTKGGGWKLGGVEEAWEYQILPSEVDKQTLLDQVRQRYTGDAKDALEKMVEKFYQEGKTRRADHLLIDHKTKSLSVTDYTGSYNNPNTGSFKADHRTKTAFYLEAFIAQQKKLGRDYLAEGFATKAWEPYWREPR